MKNHIKISVLAVMLAFVGGSFFVTNIQIEQVQAKTIGLKKINDSVVKDALSLEGYFKYFPTHDVGSIGTSIQNLSKEGKTDSSGFVWLVLARQGYNVPDNVGWYTGSMANDSKGSNKWLEAVESQNTKAGDIIIADNSTGVGVNGHTAILLENYKGSNTKIIEMVDDANGGGVRRGTIKDSFSQFEENQVTFAKAVKLRK